MTELIQQIENADRQLRAEYMETMINYRANWGQAIDNAKARGWTDPQPVPHPDDIIIDLNLANAHICGPKTEEEKARWDQSLMRRDDTQLEVSDYAERYRRARDPKRKQRYLEGWHSEQKRFDIINDNLLQRYRTNLRDRSRKEGASLPGTQKRNHWPGE